MQMVSIEKQEWGDLLRFISQNSEDISLVRLQRALLLRVKSRHTLYRLVNTENLHRTLPQGISILTKDELIQIITTTKNIEL